MAELKLGKAERTYYGKRYQGLIEGSDRTVRITWREPRRPDLAEHAYLLATGWTGAKNSMRLPAHQAAQAGHVGVTFDYTNRGITTPIKKNADDLRLVHDAMPPELRLRAIGLSMGGRAVTEFLQEANRIETATLVASAGYKRNGISLTEGVFGVLATSRETTDMIIRHPVHSAHVGLAGLAHCLRRSRAVGAEMLDLMHPDHTVHHIVDTVKLGERSPYMRFLYGSGDRLINQIAQSAGIEGLPFDHAEPYTGGHIRLVNDPSLSKYIIQLDDALPAATQLPRAA